MTPFNHVQRRTVGQLGGMFGKDKAKRICVTLEPGNGSDRPDLIVMRPEGTRREERIAVVDAYRIALTGRARLVVLEKARQRKVAKAAIRERRRLDSAEQRFRKTIRP